KLHHGRDDDQTFELVGQHSEICLENNVCLLALDQNFQYYGKKIVDIEDRLQSL
ncbi:hypothetical protein ACJX0J_022360, partial [Zea mays]